MENKFCKLLAEAIADERKAATQDYPELLEAIAEEKGGPSFRAIVNSIITDENKHHDILVFMHELVCE